MGEAAEHLGIAAVVDYDVVFEALKFDGAIVKASGAYRTIYIATLPEAVYVLHAFQTKSRRTATSDLDLARTRLKALMR